MLTKKLFVLILVYTVSAELLEAFEDVHQNLKDEILYRDKEFGIPVVRPPENFYLLTPVQKFIQDVIDFPWASLTDEDITPTNEAPTNLTKPEWCYSPFLLAKLAKAEVKIYNLLKELASQRESILFHSQDTPEEAFPALINYLEDVEESSLKCQGYLNPSEAQSDPYLYIGSHPLLVYRMIRRYALDMPNIVSELEDDTVQRIYEFTTAEGVMELPEMDDLYNALRIIQRIQQTTLITTTELARGKLENMETGIGLNFLHALEIGAFAFDDADLDLALEWFYLGFQAAKTISQTKKGNYKKIERFFNTVIDFVIDEHNRNWHDFQSDKWKPGVYTTQIDKPYRPEDYTRMTDTRRMMAREKKRRLKDKWNWALNTNFHTLCSGVNLLTEEERSKLRCRHETFQKPYWLLNPLQLEVLNNDPFVFQVYNFIGDKMMTQMKQTAIEELKRSTVVDPKNQSNVIVEESRTSIQTWLFDNEKDDEFLMKLTRRLEHLSNLSISADFSSDNYQVAAYGPSHFYAPHTDAFVSPRMDQGNRITTLMGYLSDVRAGGRTAFPVLGIFAEPIKGSLLMWHNLKKNGNGADMRTWHGGCPVLLGVKWITNKWVYSKENMRHYPCSLNPDE